MLPQKSGNSSEKCCPCHMDAILIERYRTFAEMELEE
jgi:hypothetical protein